MVSRYVFKRYSSISYKEINILVIVASRTAQANNTGWCCIDIIHNVTQIERCIGSPLKYANHHILQL